MPILTMIKEFTLLL